jgi:hypothetical protein
MSISELGRSKLDWLKDKIDYLVDAIRTATPPTPCVLGSSADSEDIIVKRPEGLVDKLVNADWQLAAMWGLGISAEVSTQEGEKELSTGHTLASEFFSMSDDEFSFASTGVGRIGEPRVGQQESVAFFITPPITLLKLPPTRQTMPPFTRSMAAWMTSCNPLAVSITTRRTARRILWTTPTLQRQNPVPPTMLPMLPSARPKPRMTQLMPQMRRPTRPMTAAMPRTTQVIQPMVLTTLLITLMTMAGVILLTTRMMTTRTTHRTAAQARYLA